jgi:hypothetical protein
MMNEFIEGGRGGPRRHAPEHLPWVVAIDRRHSRSIAGDAFEQGAGTPMDADQQPNLRWRRQALGAWIRRKPLLIGAFASLGCHMLTQQRLGLAGDLQIDLSLDVDPPDQPQHEYEASASKAMMFRERCRFRTNSFVIIM